MEDNISSKEDENEFVQLLLFSLHKWVKTNKIDKKYINNLKIQKIFFNILEDINIPVTRSWYLYGGYVHSDLIDKEILFNFHMIFPQFEENRRDEIKYKIEYLLDLYSKEILFQDQTKYLQIFYQTAPEPFKKIY